MPGIIQIDDINQSQALLGNNDENLKAIEAHFNVVIHARGQEIAVKGEKIEHVEKAELVLKEFAKVIELGNTITQRYRYKMADNNTIPSFIRFIR